MTDAATSSALTATGPALFAHVAEPGDAARHFAARLAFETDVSDVAVALREEPDGFVLVDTRSEASWRQGRVPGAVHLPTRRIAAEAAELVPAGTPVVVYCWGPGCNGAQRAALEFARLGHPVKEMIGGFEYWVREGFSFETDEGRRARAADPLTNVTVGRGLDGDPATPGAIACAC
ncbi:rhodanese-like domain-containing protein [Agromyces mediolanus]|uniref:rhodanese-like domain-containing protein n=1 Tax=Agromyces mediolanus TaxID=41986 RepID=UPI0020406BA3|nr:rhodanese-like domain-containing protein [Agromyces mediolanus]MCM3656378.1 rhodanese-like domain-containing protein [Agromyces mediolanus]